MSPRSTNSPHIDDDEKSSQTSVPSSPSASPIMVSSEKPTIRNYHLEKRIRKDDKDGDFESISDDISTHQHTLSTLALMAVMLSHSYLLISAFPYSGFMAIFLIDGANEENAGSYAGLISAAFMIGRAASSYHWGKIADRYGRRYVILSSLALSAFFSLLFGFSPTFGFAIFARLMLGFVNGLVGTVKTIVSELSNGNEKLETRAMGLVIGMWGYGFIFSPALSGILSEPVTQYPENALVQDFAGVLSSFPFLLPNLVGSLFCSISLIAVNLLITETLPEEKRRSPDMILHDLTTSIARVTPSWFGSTEKEKQPILPVYETTGYDGCSSSLEDKGDQFEYEECLRQDVVEAKLSKNTESTSFLCTADSTKISSTRKKRRSTLLVQKASSVEANAATILGYPNTRRHLLVYWLVSFVSVSVDEAFPLWCLSKAAGLGLSEGSIGSILSACGLAFAFCQYFAFATIVNQFGLYPSIRIGSFAMPVVALVPFALYFNDDEEPSGELDWKTFAYLIGVLAIYRVFGSVYMSSLTIATNRTVPPSQRATMNGISTMGGSFAKGGGPAFAGLMVAFFLSGGYVDPEVGGYFIFAILGALSVLIVLFSFGLHADED